jgi:predicted nucleic acid-binding protein
MKIFVDETAWINLLLTGAPFHSEIAREFESAIKNGDSLFTHNIAVGIALSEIKHAMGIGLASKFNEVIEEAYTGAYLHILWIGRRTQKEAVRLFRKESHLSLGLYDFAAYIFMKRRRIGTIVTTKTAFKKLGVNVVPEIVVPELGE